VDTFFFHPITAFILFKQKASQQKVNTSFLNLLSKIVLPLCASSPVDDSIEKIEIN